jgi:hypothetical protein
MPITPQILRSISASEDPEEKEEEGGAVGEEREEGQWVKSGRRGSGCRAGGGAVGEEREEGQWVKSGRRGSG